mmetsp:Transcript_5922/g.11681  ORF Transcript_5922/g.11681 Transcript_5922/m.11681 type:complete len:150 (-) Transcript_5922:847-1296(-)
MWVIGCVCDEYVEGEAAAELEPPPRKSQIGELGVFSRSLVENPGHFKAMMLLRRPRSGLGGPGWRATLALRLEAPSLALGRTPLHTPYRRTCRLLAGSLGDTNCVFSPLKDSSIDMYPIACYDQFIEYSIIPMSGSVAMRGCDKLAWVS